jgi:mannose/fructose/N-acetylgalactosamine-specific phosphotransferase system component IID
MIDKWLKSIDQKIINIETNALSITDKSAIESNKKAWRRFSLLQLFLGSIMPILVFVLAIITIKTVEAGLIKLFGALVFCLISIIVGIIFRVLGIYSIKLAHEQK